MPKEIKLHVSEDQQVFETYREALLHEVRVNLKRIIGDCSEETLNALIDNATAVLEQLERVPPKSKEDQLERMISRFKKDSDEPQVIGQALRPGFVKFAEGLK